MLLCNCNENTHYINRREQMLYYVGWKITPDKRDLIEAKTWYESKVKFIRSKTKGTKLEGVPNTNLLEQVISKSSEDRRLVVPLMTEEEIQKEIEKLAGEV